jgi:hypothetical protein
MNLRGLRLLIWWRASVAVLLNTVLYSIKMQPVPVYSISLLGPLALPYCIKLVLYFPRHFLYSIPKYLCTQFRRSPLSRFTIVLDFFIRSTVQYSTVLVLHQIEGVVHRGTFPGLHDSLLQFGPL